MINLFNKKPIKTVDMSTGELMNHIPYDPWTKVEYISVVTIDGRHIVYPCAKFRTIDYLNLIIKTENEQIFYNLDNVIRFYFKEAKNE